MLLTHNGNAQFLFQYWHRSTSATSQPNFCSIHNMPSHIDCSRGSSLHPPIIPNHIVQNTGTDYPQEDGHPCGQLRRLNRRVSLGSIELTDTITVNCPCHDFDHFDNVSLTYPIPAATAASSLQTINIRLTTTFSQAGIRSSGPWTMVSVESHPTHQEASGRAQFAAELCGRLQVVNVLNEPPAFYKRLDLLAGNANGSPQPQTPRFELRIVPIPPEEWDDDELLLINGQRDFFNRAPSEPEIGLPTMHPRKGEMDGNTLRQDCDRKIQTPERDLSVCPNTEQIVDAVGLVLKVTDKDTAEGSSKVLRPPSGELYGDLTGAADKKITETLGTRSLPSTRQAAGMPPHMNRAMQKPQSRPPIPAVGEPVPEGEFPIPRIRRSLLNEPPDQHSTLILNTVSAQLEERPEGRGSHVDRYSCFPETPLEDMTPWTRIGWSQHVCMICHTTYLPEEKVAVLPCEHLFHEECLLPKQSEFPKGTFQSTGQSLEEVKSHILCGESSDIQLSLPSTDLNPSHILDPRPRLTRRSGMVDRRINNRCCLCQLPQRNIRPRSILWKDIWEETVRNTKSEKAGGPKSKADKIIEKMRECRDRYRHRTRDEDRGKLISTFPESENNLISQDNNAKRRGRIKICRPTKAKTSQSRLADSLTIEDFAPSNNMMGWIDRYYKLVEGQYREKRR